MLGGTLHQYILKCAGILIANNPHILKLRWAHG